MAGAYAGGLLSHYIPGSVLLVMFAVGLEFSLRRKSWGPNYVRFGLELQDNFAGTTSFNARARVLVTGAGSALETVGVGPFINIGANNAAGNGSFQLLAGATASSMFMNIGRNGGSGLRTVMALPALLGCG